MDVQALAATIPCNFTLQVQALKQRLERDGGRGSG